jgi:hypothetical protein
MCWLIFEPAPVPLLAAFVCPVYAFERCPCRCRATMLPSCSSNALDSRRARLAAPFSAGASRPFSLCNEVHCPSVTAPTSLCQRCHKAGHGFQVSEQHGQEVGLHCLLVVCGLNTELKLSCFHRAKHIRFGVMTMANHRVDPVLPPSSHSGTVSRARHKCAVQHSCTMFSKIAHIHTNSALLTRSH